MTTVIISIVAFIAAFGGYAVGFFMGVRTTNQRHGRGKELMKGHSQDVCPFNGRPCDAHELYECVPKREICARQDGLIDHD